MSEKSPRDIRFHHVPNGEHEFEYEPSGGLADIFKNADYVKAETIKNYVQQIVEQVKQSPNTEAQRACVMDLLRENNIRNLLVARKVDEKDIDEVERMTIYWIKEIKKRIIEKLKKDLPDDLYFFVKEKQKESIHHFNKKSTVTDSQTSKEYFLKESTAEARTKKQQERSLKKLKSALAKLVNPDKDMPFIIAPKNIGQSIKDGRVSEGSLSYIANNEDLTTVEDLLKKELDEPATKKVLIGILDCLKGARFLAQNGLTVTDLDTITIGKNFGINNKNGHGALFDFDGLLEVDSNIGDMFGPQTKDGRPMLDLFAPEYRQFFDGVPTEATAEAMVWEIGNSLKRLAAEQIKKLWGGDIFMVSAWEKIEEFSEKMIAEKPSDRPSFDICTATLEEIVNKLSDKI